MGPGLRVNHVHITISLLAASTPNYPINASDHVVFRHPHTPFSYMQYQLHLMERLGIFSED